MDWDSPQGRSIMFFLCLFITIMGFIFLFVFEKHPITLLSIETFSVPKYKTPAYQQGADITNVAPMDETKVITIYHHKPWWDTLMPVVLVLSLFFLGTTTLAYTDRNDWGSGAGGW